MTRSSSVPTASTSPSVSDPTGKPERGRPSRRRGRNRESRSSATASTGITAATVAAPLASSCARTTVTTDGRLAGAAADTRTISVPTSSRSPTARLATANAVSALRTTCVSTAATAAKPSGPDFTLKVMGSAADVSVTTDSLKSSGVVARVKATGPGATVAGRLRKISDVDVSADAVATPSGVGWPRATVHAVTHEGDVMRTTSPVVGTRRRSPCRSVPAAVTVTDISSTLAAAMVKVTRAVLIPLLARPRSIACVPSAYATATVPASPRDTPTAAAVARPGPADAAALTWTISVPMRR
mmetsp:Transcript_60618/g.126940  ORF Transcript_60618/g.126940 Transcript_60618/m.126940 type:complete len:299 (+) Transcript_60618:1807-2703(+)